MTTQVEINYEKLVADYMQSLTTVLRGFDSGAGHAFLETWVYDEDEMKSILGIVEAARDSGLSNLSIRLGPKTLTKVDVPGLKIDAERYGEVTTKPAGDEIDFNVSFTGAESRAGGQIVRATPRFGEKAVRTKTSAPSAPINVHYSDGTMNPLYAEALRRSAQSRVFEGDLREEPVFVFAQSTRDGVTLAALVEPAKHIVGKVAYRGTTTETQRGLMEGLCRLTAGKPILECSDHAVIQLEYELRNHAQPRPVPGIVTPENSDAMFELPTALVRALLGDYRRKTGFKSIENTYDQPISDAWRSLSSDERAKRIQEAIEHHPAGEGVHVERLETPKRVVVGFLNGLNGISKQERLMELEDHLKRTLEPTLQLYVEPKPDANRIRRLKEGGTP